jgi:hypothetical protein
MLIDLLEGKTSVCFGTTYGVNLIQTRKRVRRKQIERRGETEKDAFQ